MTTMICLPDASVKRETDKAVLLTVGYSHACGHGERDVWFPRSQFKIEADNVFVAAWLLSKKEREIEQDYRGFYNFHADATSMIEV